MNMRRTSTAVVIAAAMGLGACAAPGEPHRGAYPGGAAYPSQPNPEVARYGYVDAIETVNAERREGVGVGAIGGAIAGGAIGSQIGSGSGRTAATIGGAVVGGVVGHQVEQRVRGNQAAGAEYMFRVRMDDGTYQTFRKETHDNIRVGDRVRVERGNIFAL